MLFHSRASLHYGSANLQKEMNMTHSKLDHAPEVGIEEAGRYDQKNYLAWAFVESTILIVIFSITNINQRGHCKLNLSFLTVLNLTQTWTVANIHFTDGQTITVTWGRIWINTGSQ